jgi:hypothetical protein
VPTFKKINNLRLYLKHLEKEKHNETNLKEIERNNKDQGRS